MSANIIELKQYKSVATKPRHSARPVHRGRPQLCGPFGYRALGFKEAGDLILQSCIRKQQPPGYFLQPILHSYRQYMELELKHLLMLSAWLLDVDRTPPETHSLLPLWFEARTRLYEIAPVMIESPPGDLERLEVCIGELDIIESDSDAFGYPFRRAGGIFAMDDGLDSMLRLLDTMSAAQEMLEAFVMMVHDAIVRKESQL